VHEFDTPGKTRLRVKNAAGMISVTPSETGRTTVELEALRDDDATHEAIERATVELNGSEVTVEIGVGGKGFGVGPAWISFGRTPQVGVRIRCPEDTDLECTTASADMSATGRLGEVEVKTASGDVAVEQVAGLRVQSASGDVRGATVDGEARIQTVSGDVRLGTVAGPVSATLVSGDFAIEDAHTDLAAKTVSGDQRIGAIREGQIKLQSVSGDVRVGVRPGTRLHIDANSVSGDVGSELDVKDAPSDTPSGSEARLQAKTVSGDIEITRAAPVSA
jgi:putative adhesin